MIWLIGKTKKWLSWHLTRDPSSSLPANAAAVSPVPSRLVSPPLVTCGEHLFTLPSDKLRLYDLEKDVVKRGHVDGEALKPALVPPGGQGSKNPRQLTFHPEQEFFHCLPESI